VLLFDGEKLLLIQGDRRRSGTPVGPAYHHLKAVAHLPLTLFVELSGAPDGPPAEGTARRIRDLRARVAAVEQEFDRIDFATGDRDVLRRILAAGARFLDDVLRSGMVDGAALRPFAASLKADIERTIDVAAAIELGHYQAEIEAWRKELSDDEWRSLRAVVIGSQMPRRDNRVVQLLAALLGVTGEGPRIVYAEGLYEEQRALNLLGTHLLDAEAASAFFDDSTRLERDLLADGAAKYVRENVKPIP
jgi:hypothetical protein